MQEIKLVQMRICNFKGIRELDIKFGGEDINVLGDNGTGKTSIIDSFTWLLFGKDSLGRADFGIKPTDNAGNIIHQLETSVEAVFGVSGVIKVFKKTLSEVWTRKRGAAEAEFTRNENNFYIDGVPKKKAEYASAIKELIDEEVFKILTNPLYFNESVNWKDRRSVLLTICGEVSDEEVISSNVELSPLLSMLKGKSVADFKEIAASKMKSINRELDMIPVKINEAELAKPNVEALEVDISRKATLTKEIEDLTIQRSNIVNGTEVLQERQNIKILQQRYNSVGKDFFPEKTPIAAEITELNDKVRELEFILHSTERHRDMIADRFEEQKRIREKLSKEWDAIMEERFTDSICPTCHRELPEEEVEARRREFNAKKVQKLDDIEKKNEELRATIELIASEMKADAETVIDTQVKVDFINDTLSKANEALSSLVNSKEAEFEQERREINAKIAEAEERIRKYTDGITDVLKEVDGKIATLSAELSVINEAIANKALLERQEARIAELKSQQIHLATEYNTAQRELFLSEQFIVAKVNMLTERINQKFKFANFKLFDKQINGGINEVCEVTYKGIPYKDLNNAMKINIGLDVINTIAAHYGVTVPIMIDNCESVNELFHTEAQQVRFYVSKDKQLTFSNN